MLQKSVSSQILSTADAPHQLIVWDMNKNKSFRQPIKWLSRLLKAQSISESIFGEFDLVYNSQIRHSAQEICLDTFLVDLECLLGFHVIAGFGWVADKEDRGWSLRWLEVIKDEARIIAQRILQLFETLTSMFARYFEHDIITLALCDHKSLMLLSQMCKMVIDCLTNVCVRRFNHPSFLFWILIIKIRFFQF